MKVRRPPKSRPRLVLTLAVTAVLVVTSAFATQQIATKEDLKCKVCHVKKGTELFTDKGKYPDSLQALVDDGYIRKIPVDPMTGSETTWVEEQSSGGAEEDQDDPSLQGGIANVHSGSDAEALDGTRYSEW